MVAKDAVSPVLDQSAAFFHQERVNKMIKQVENYKESFSRETMVLSRPETYSQHRLWVLSRISDYSQSKFDLDIQYCASANIPLKQPQAFASKSLAPIKLDSYVHYLTRAQLGMSGPPVSGTVPFTLGTEQATHTHCSQATIQRITTDVLKFSGKTNSKTTPTLL